MKNVLNLNESIDGSRIKQGDQSIMQYVLTDGNGDDLKLGGKKADVYLYNASDVSYKLETTVSEKDKGQYVVDVVITDIVPANIYNLEVIVDDMYVFPSDSNTKIEVIASVLGKLQNGSSIKPSVFEELIDYGMAHGKFDHLKGEQGDKGDKGDAVVATPKIYTRDEYDQLETKDKNTLYFISEV